MKKEIKMKRKKIVSIQFITLSQAKNHKRMNKNKENKVKAK